MKPNGSRTEKPTKTFIIYTRKLQRICPVFERQTNNRYVLGVNKIKVNISEIQPQTKERRSKEQRKSGNGQQTRNRFIVYNLDEVRTDEPLTSCETTSNAGTEPRLLFPGNIRSQIIV